VAAVRLGAEEEKKGGEVDSVEGKTEKEKVRVLILLIFELLCFRLKQKIRNKPIPISSLFFKKKKERKKKKS